MGQIRINEERPHTHHGGKPPGSLYDASPREYPTRLRGYHLGFNEEADGIWSIYFGEILLAKMDDRNYIIRE